MPTCPVCQFTFDAAKVPDGMCPRCLLMGGADEVMPTMASRDDYEIMELIGRGGMGAIYRAWQPSLGRLVAVKVLPEGSEAMQGAAQRFENEARVLGLLQHPNIMPVHDLGIDAEGRSFYAMKLVKGRTLQQILNDLRNGDAHAVRQYPLAALLTVFEKICDALSFAHSQGVLHRDLKPDNIMVGEFGEVLVLDWGLAKVAGVDIDAASQQSLDEMVLGMTLDGDVMGTPQFMSPEQAQGRIAQMDERSDVFSLGGVLYAILTLLPPVEGEDVKSVLKRVREGAITPPARRSTQAARVEASVAQGRVQPAKSVASALPHCPGGRVPAALSSVAMKALQVDTAQRYQTVAELQADVVAYQRGFATSAEEAGALRLLQLFILRHRATSTALVALVLFSIGFVIKLVQSEQAAQQSAREANEARIVAQNKGEDARRALARSQTSLAEAAYSAEDTRAMLAALDGVPADLRDADWRYLLGQTDNSTHRFDASHGGPFSGVIAHPTWPGVFATVSTQTGDFVFLDSATGKVVGGFPASPRQKDTRFKCMALDFTADGKRLMSGRPNDAGVSIYDVKSGKPLVEWDARHAAWVRFNHDGTRALHATFGQMLCVYDATTGKKLWERQPFDRAIFTREGDVIAVYAGQVSLLDGATGQEKRVVLGLNTGVISIATSVDGSMLFLGCADGSVCCRQMSTGAKVFDHLISGPSRPVQVALSGDGKRLIAAADLASGARVVHLLETRTGRTLLQLRGGGSIIEGLGLHPLTDDVLIGGPDTRAWSSASRFVEIRVCNARPNAAVFWGSADFFIHYDEKFNLAVACPSPGGGTVLRPPPVPLSLAEREGVWLADAVGDLAVIGRWTVGGSPIFLIRRTGHEFKVMAETKSGSVINRLRLSADGRRMAVVDGFRLVEIFDAGTGKLSSTCDPAGLTTVTSIAWLGVDRLAGIGTQGKRGEPGEKEHLLIWEAATGQVLNRIVNPTRMNALACAPDGRSLAEGGEGQRVRIRDVETLEVRQDFRAHDAAITALAFHPVKPLLATASSDITVKLWDVRAGKLLQELQPSSEEVELLLFSPEGTVLACMSSRSAAHLLRVEHPSLPTQPAQIPAVASGVKEANPLESLVQAERWSELREKLTAALDSAADDDIRWLQLAVALRQIGDREAWQAFISQRLARTAESHKPAVLDRGAKACVFFPQPVTGEQAQMLMNMADRLAKLPVNDLLTPYYDLTIALVRLRCGHAAEAEELLNQQRGRIGSWLAIARRSVRILAIHAMGNREQALKFLQSAESIAAQENPQAASVAGPYWHDRMFALLLLQEAQELVKR
jgi:serine/threonine protein kinase/WD40 repeat protein